MRDDISRWRESPCPWVGRINTVKMTVLPKAIQIQCNPYLTTNANFHRTRTKNFTIRMETQKTPNSQSSLEKENGAGGIKLPDFRLYYKAAVKTVWY